MKKNVSVIGNKKTKETHIASCGCLKLMKEENMIGFNSLQQAMNNGFDTCGHCLESKDAAKTQNKYKFCILLNGKEYCGSVIRERPRGEIITLRAKVLSGDEQESIEDIRIKLTNFPDGINEKVISTERTDKDGVAETEFNPIALPQGSTEFRAYFPDGTHLKMYIEFLPSIRNVRISPRRFERSTDIIFDLLEDSVINISIYKNTNFSGWFSHRKTIRSYPDGTMKKGNDIKVKWDGTNDMNKQTWRGTYVVRLETPKDFVYHDNNGDILYISKTVGKIEPW